MLPVGGKLWTESGSEFGSEKGYVFLIVRYIYGPKSSGAAWRYKLAETLSSMGYRSNESNHDFWINSSTVDNSTAHYKYMLVYVDDVL